MQRSPLEVIVRVHIGAALEQELAGVEIAIAGGDHERRFEVFVAHVDGQTAFECVEERVAVASVGRVAHVLELGLGVTQVPGRVVLEWVVRRRVPSESVRVGEVNVAWLKHGRWTSVILLEIKFKNFNQSKILFIY